MDELRDLEATLASLSPDMSSRFFGVALMREGLERRRWQLLGRVGDERLELALTRSFRSGSGGEIRLLSGVLGSLQESLAAIAQSLAGRPTARGLIPSSIRDSVELRLAMAVPGSLHLTLTPAFAQEVREPTFDAEDGPLLQLSVEALFDVMQTARGDREGLLRHIAQLGPRAAIHLQALSRVLEDGEASGEFRWSSARREVSAVLDTRGAGFLQRVITEVDERPTRSVFFAGRLVGGSLLRRSFELELEDGSLISGQVNEDALGALEALFGAPCIAAVDVRELTLRTGETREAFRLTSLSEGSPLREMRLNLGG